MLGVWSARLFGLAASERRDVTEDEASGLSSPKPDTRVGADDSVSPQEEVSTPVKQRVPFGLHQGHDSSDLVPNEDEQATPVRPTPPDQVRRFYDAGPTPMTPLAVHPSTQTIAARSTSPPPSPSRCLPLNLEALLLAAAQPAAVPAVAERVPESTEAGADNILAAAAQEQESAITASAMAAEVGHQDQDFDPFVSSPMCRLETSTAAVPSSLAEEGPLSAIKVADQAKEPAVATSLLMTPANRQPSKCLDPSGAAPTVQRPAGSNSAAAAAEAMDSTPTAAGAAAAASNQLRTRFRPLFTQVEPTSTPGGKGSEETAAADGHQGPISFGLGSGAGAVLSEGQEVGGEGGWSKQDTSTPVPAAPPLRLAKDGKGPAEAWYGEADRDGAKTLRRRAVRPLEDEAEPLPPQPAALAAGGPQAGSEVHPDPEAQMQGNFEQERPRPGRLLCDDPASPPDAASEGLAQVALVGEEDDEAAAEPLSAHPASATQSPLPQPAVSHPGTPLAPEDLTSLQHTAVLAAVAEMAAGKHDEAGADGVLVAALEDAEDTACGVAAEMGQGFQQQSSPANPTPVDSPVEARNVRAAAAAGATTPGRGISTSSGTPRRPAASPRSLAVPLSPQKAAKALAAAVPKAAGSTSSPRASLVKSGSARGSRGGDAKVEGASEAAVRSPAAARAPPGGGGAAGLTAKGTTAASAAAEHKPLRCGSGKSGGWDIDTFSGNSSGGASRGGVVGAGALPRYAAPTAASIARKTGPGASGTAAQAGGDLAALISAHGSESGRQKLHRSVLAFGGSSGSLTGLNGVSGGAGSGSPFRAR